MIAVFAIVLGLSGCTERRGTPPEFPFPVTLPSSVSARGEVRHESSGNFEVPLKGSKEVVSGERWSGHVRVEGFSGRDPRFLASLERALVESTGWEIVYRDDLREPPVATLHRSLGGEHLWITLEGWPEDVTVTMVHRK
ncbi:hypothetical protein L6R52_06125 [Myxococcota bacterium]|nr:hypothetical protein [Myxococcota bacterium]